MASRSPYGAVSPEYWREHLKRSAQIIEHTYNWRPWEVVFQQGMTKAERHRYFTRAGAERAARRWTGLKKTSEGIVRASYSETFPRVPSKDLER